jgi:xylono-1,5-lactonase
MNLEGDGWRCLWQAKAHLGEGIIWDSRDGCIYWLDVEAPLMHRYELVSGKRESWAPPMYVCAIALRAAGGFIATTRDGYAYVDFAAKSLRPLFDPRSDPAKARFNDGCLDLQGRYWAGTVSNSQWADTTTAEDKEASARHAADRACGELFSLDASLRAERADGGYLATNGPAVSPDGRVLYENDSMKRVTYAYDLHSDGSLSGKREFIHHDSSCGFPDGMTCDEEGGLWIAFYDDPYFRRYGADGALVEQRLLPVRQGLRPAFGGERMDRLFLCSGSLVFNDKSWRAQPLAGSLFEILDPGVRGIPTTPFKG